MAEIIQHIDNEQLEKTLAFFSSKFGGDMCLWLNDTVLHGFTDKSPKKAMKKEQIRLDGNTIITIEMEGFSDIEQQMIVGQLTILFELAQQKQKFSLVQQRLIEEIRAHTELEEALKFMELRALQSQINPHFLFNTLSTLAGLAMFEDAPKTEALISALSRLLRYSLRSIGQTVTVTEELKYVKDYCAIQKARFGDRIEVVYEVAPELGSAQVPVLTLQPVVENAIIHGLEAVEKGQLVIRGFRDEDDIVLVVEDDGVGIKSEKLEAIRALSVNSTGRSHTTGIGFANVHRRLQHFYGQNYGLHIDSVVGEGTAVTVRIPYTL